MTAQFLLHAFRRAEQTFIGSRIGLEFISVKVWEP